MPVSSRFLLGLSLTLIVASCGNNGHTTSAGDPGDPSANEGKNQVQDSVRVRNEVSDSMLAQIIRYYHKEYAHDTIAMRILRTDSTMEVSFADTTGDSNTYQGPLFIAYISLVKDINPALHGDIDGDGKDDILFTVHTEGGGGGGNAWWDDHFLFIGNGGGIYIMADVTSDGELMAGSGHFFPREIASQTVAGIGNGYADGDAHCCPSLFYRMHVRLKGGKLKTIDKTAIAKPADFD